MVSVSGARLLVISRTYARAEEAGASRGCTWTVAKLVRTDGVQGF